MRILRSHGWWLAMTVGWVVVLGVLVGYWYLWSVYAALNAYGAVAWSDSMRRPARRKTIQALAAAFLPVGFIGLFVEDESGLSPSEAVGVGADDPDVRRESARNSFAPRNGGGIGAP